jgi:hypothetical protein
MIPDETTERDHDERRSGVRVMRLLSGVRILIRPELLEVMPQLAAFVRLQQSLTKLVTPPLRMAACCRIFASVEPIH